MNEFHEKCASNDNEIYVELDLTGFIYDPRENVLRITPVSELETNFTCSKGACLE